MWLLTVLVSISPLSDLIIDGYTDKLAVRPGDSLTLYLNAKSKADDYTLKLFDLGNKEVARFQVAVNPQEVARKRPWEEGYGYQPNAKISIPNLKSGVYLWEGKIPLIIKSPNPRIAVLYSSNTENAYCPSGGKSLYGFNSTELKMANKVSFHRPIPLPKHSEAFLRWLYDQCLEDVGYITDMDMDNYKEFQKASLLIIPGHSEYWTLQSRKNFDRFVNDGKDALVLSGNTMWWQVRYESNNTKLVCYRNGDDDPVSDKKLKTINWNERELGYPILSSIGVDFSLAGFGLKHPDKGWNGYKIVNGNSPLLEGVNLKKGDIIPLASDEHDGTLVSAFTGMNSPLADNKALGFEKVEIVGYDSTYRLGSDLMATWIVFKKSKSSGTVINTASTDWCSSRGMGNATIQQITLTMINKLLRRENVFSPSQEIKMVN